MRSTSILSIVIILFGAACVDRISFKTGTDLPFTVAVEGHISDLPGPYIIKVSKAFDIESRYSIRENISVKEVRISDDQGNSEILKEVSNGVYHTSADGIRGTEGRAYKLRVELLTGRVYESIADTLHSNGKLDSLYYEFTTKGISPIGNTNYAFDFFFDGSAFPESKFYFLWKFTATFKTDTDPLRDKEGEPCGEIDCSGCSICNLVPKCSGVRNLGTPKNPRFIRTGPCTCCTCWYNIFNDVPILSDNQLFRSGTFTMVRAGSVPVNVGVFQHKVYAEVSQMSLSHRAFLFWRAVKDQRNAINSLFQPVSGKIPVNFIQTSGTPSPIEGIFFAAAISSKTVILNRRNIPERTFIFPEKDSIIGIVCTKLFPNSSTLKPSFWEE